MLNSVLPQLNNTSKCCPKVRNESQQVRSETHSVLSQCRPFISLHNREENLCWFAVKSRLTKDKSNKKIFSFLPIMLIISKICSVTSAIVAARPPTQIQLSTLLLITERRSTLTGERSFVLCGYLSDCVSLVIADAQRVVVTSQSQQILSAPAATRDLLCMFAWQCLEKEETMSMPANFTFSVCLAGAHLCFFSHQAQESCVRSVDCKSTGFPWLFLLPTADWSLTTEGRTSDLYWNRQN